MRREAFVLPELYSPPPGTAHGVRVGERVFVSGMEPLDRSGLVVEGDTLTQGRQIYRNIDAVLKAARTGWNDVAKYNAYLVDVADRSAAREAHYEYMPIYQRAGAMISLPSPDARSRLQVEIIVHDRTPKHCITNVPDVFMTLGSPHAVRVGDTVYVTGQQPVAGSAPLLRVGELADSGAFDKTTLGVGDIAAQAHIVYANFDAVLRAAGLSWSDVVRAEDYLNGRDLDPAVLKARGGFLQDHAIPTTSIVSGLMRDDWMIESEILAHVGPKRPIIAKNAYRRSPSHRHAMLAGDTLYSEGMLGWRTDGSVGNETIEAEAGRIFDHLTHVLEEAGMGWAQVVHVRSYHRDRAQVQTVRELRAKRLPEGLFATTDVVTAPSLSGAALEIEIIAVGG